ncbi:MAG: hypothetical protein IPK19_01045 [Chloroflexi bacterium]|nr:hypothetical protein [Chloroflexota bacterium]
MIDTLDVIGDLADQLLEDAGNRAVEGAGSVKDIVAAARQAMVDVSANPARWGGQLNALVNSDWPALNAAVVTTLARLEGRLAARVSDLHTYLGRLRHQLISLQRDIEQLTPWLLYIDRAPAALRATLEALPPLKETTKAAQHVRAALDDLESAAGASTGADAESGQAWKRELRQALAASELSVRDLLSDLEKVRGQIDRELDAIDFSFLYDEQRNLFRIGYNVESEQPDASHYDLLASEARLASTIAIARGEVPYKHWLYLDRPIASLAGGQVLQSWSGTMFEYLMPLLLMRQEAGTLLSSSTFGAVEVQMNYGREHRTPWGISESGFYVFDADQNYQYRAFGVPELALKRGQDLDHVVAPYASMLALTLQPRAVIDNLCQLVRVGALDTYGLIEAVDYTSSRLPLGRQRALVQEYMAHHQGMILLSLVNFLQEEIMVQRFHANPEIQSVDLLLLEQMPTQIEEKQIPPASVESTAQEEAIPLNLAPWELPAGGMLPQVHYLSNGRYAVMLTGAGSGYSQWKGRAITRWRADTTLDEWGTWLYLHDRESGDLWSAGRQPIGGEPERLQAIFHPHKVELVRRDHGMTSRLEVVVPPDDDLEIRRLSVTNHGGRTRTLTVCSYAEMVMAAQSADQRHQAFNKMFIESEFLPGEGILLFRRRLRSIHDEPFFVAHLLVFEDSPGSPSAVRFETDRAQFLGRNGTPDAPAALAEGRLALSGTSGATLDPVMALAQEIEIRPHATTQIAFLTIAGSDRAEVLHLARAYSQWTRIDHAFDQARYQAQRELRHLDLDSPALERVQILLSGLLYPQARLRAEAETLAASTLSQPALWGHGISGDFPIMLAEIGAADELGLAAELIQAHTYWTHRGFRSTLVLLNTHDTGYDQALGNQLLNLVTRMHSSLLLNRHDGIFILRAEQLNEANLALLRSAARVRLIGQQGLLADQLKSLERPRADLPAFFPTLPLSEIERPGEVVARPADLLFDNGYGGFTPAGDEYVMRIAPDQPTPAPWSNVIANEQGGFVVTESGGGFSWAFNSGENRLTVWRNDPVADRPGEAVYLRDEETGAIWSPTPLPAGSGQPHLVRHGFGYSVFEHRCHGIDQTLTLFTAPDDPVKFARLRLRNTLDRPRRLTVTYYAEWVLGPTRDLTQQYLIPEFDAETGSLMARNPYSIEFGSHQAFLTASKPLHGFTADRMEFLGRFGDYRQPASLRRIGLSGTVRAGLDVCAAIQLHVDLPPGGEEEVCFILGQGQDRAAALDLSRQYRQAEAIQSAWEETRRRWRDVLGSIVVRTPDQAMNLLLPWLLYQALACRIWGRSALYQSSGAYGFRDQLQDVMALLHARPDLARRHILEAARHQFEAGDVLHWWHPPAGRGVRTHFADDLVWLPFVVAHYVGVTGDEGLLREEVPFLVADPLRPGEEERYGLYQSTAQEFTIYEHCLRALDRGFTPGAHGLPLMQAGDWNDGMNRVGVEGRGESVWMAWFLYTTLDRFLPLCEVMADPTSAAKTRARLSALSTAVEQHAWDGEWYRRAYYDDGTPLGSAENRECRIDSLTQSWAVLSGAADPGRAGRAMQSVEEHLVREADGLIALFTPPFDRTEHDPGYIKGYPPGIRENGGQYTHAALWFVWALAEMGQGDRAVDLFALLNPILHSDTRAEADHYRVEPYVVAADVYGAPPHTGRGGWTWYTGSSGWMYRLGVEAILGLRRAGAALIIDPRIARDWPGFEVDYRYGGSVYHIRVDNSRRVQSGIATLTLDGVPLDAGPKAIPLVDDGQPHVVAVVLG